MKTGFVGLQTCFRRWKAEKRYKALRDAAIRVQTCFRRYSKEKKYKKLLKSVILIQTCFRRWSAQRKYQIQRISAIKIQTWWRSFYLRNKFKALVRAALKAQTMTRMYLASRDYKILRKSIIKIQTCFRRWDLEKDYKTAKRGIILLQALARRKKLQADYRKIRKGIILLQAILRGRKAFALYQIQRTSIITIQTWFRKWRAFIAYQRALKAVRLLQPYSRGMVARIKYQRALKAIILIQSVIRMWLARRIYVKHIAAFIRFQQKWRKVKRSDRAWVMLRAVLRIQSVFRGKMQRMRLEKRKKAHMISINYDVECKQLLVANRSEFYNIFKSYMDKVEPAIKRKNAVLFAVNFRIVPELVTRHRFDQLITELVQILNEDPDSLEQKIETVDAPLHYIAYLRLLILLARVADDNYKGEKVSLGTHLSNILRMMDASGGKQKMGGSLSRNSFSSGNMIYLGSVKLPSHEKALAFDLQQWLLDTHFRGSSRVGNTMDAKTGKGEKN